jgi:nitroreductase
METMDAIRQRRSIRHFEDQPVPEELLKTVLDAIRWAPSWANTQCWEIVVVKDSGTKLKLQEAAGRNPASKALAAAPVVLVFCGRQDHSGYYNGSASTKHGDWCLFDLGIATQNAALAAHDAGLGSVVVGLFDHDKVAGILCVPDDIQVVSMLPLGYPARPGTAPPRREISEFTHYERY